MHNIGFWWLLNTAQSRGFRMTHWISPTIEMPRTLEWSNPKTQTIWWQLKHETWSNWSNPPLSGSPSTIGGYHLQWCFGELKWWYHWSYEWSILAVQTYILAQNLRWAMWKKALATCATRRGQPKKKEKEEEGEERRRNRKRQLKVSNEQG